MGVKAEKKATFDFQANVTELMGLVADALYSNKEIFLRELISNGSDALSRIKFAALADDSLYEDDGELAIRVTCDPEAGTVTVSDNGDGMTRQEVIDNIGMIANSGTKKFIESMKSKSPDGNSLIGQFGVGFYSAFVVADKVTVLTRKMGTLPAEGVKWESTGKDGYTIENLTQDARGTSVILHLKTEEKEFLQDFRLKSIVTKYSNFIAYPVIMMEEEVIEPSTEDAEKEEDAKGDTKAKQEKTYKPVVVNEAKALWTRRASEVSDDEYKAFYQTIAHDMKDPLVWSHNQVEGKLEYTSLLYIPSQAPFDLFYREHQRGLKLYVQRVFIMDDAEQLLPQYLRFVKGLIDSNDLPLNVSREMLQSSKAVDTIRSACVKKVLKLLADMMKNDAEKYATFWREFGAVLKEGTGEDFANREELTNLLLFSSTHDEKEQADMTLQQYVDRMQPEQEKIYYVIADSFSAAKHSPHLQIFRKKGIEVLLLSDRVDEWLVSHVTEFSGKKLQSVAKGEIDELPGGKQTKKQEKQAKEQETDYEDVLKRVAALLSDDVSEVKLSKRLVDSPACLVTDEKEMSAHLKRMLEQAGQAIPDTKPVLELNPDHAIVQCLKAEQSEARFEQLSRILYQQSILAEGAQLDDPASFVSNVNQLLEDMLK